MEITMGEAVGSILSPAELLAASRATSAGWIANDQLTDLIEQIHSATGDAKRLVLDRSEAVLTERVESGSWSVAECFDHLAQTTRAFLPAISDAIAAAPILATNRPLQTGTVARLFIRNLEPPYRVRFKVLHQLAPHRQNFEAGWSGFIESQSQLSAAVHSAAGRAIDQKRIKSPVYARISYNVYGALRILAAHQRRHLWQIEQIMNTLEVRRARKDGA